jgi:phosphatidylglycerophosphatase A
VTWRWILAAFVLFRIFDIIKPFPGRRAERVGGGIAVMLDDGVAGAYTVIILHGLRALMG